MGKEIDQNRPNFFELYGRSVSRSNITGDLLIFSKYGEYLAGRDRSDVPLGTKVVVHAPTAEAGYVRWEDKRPIEYRMGLIGEGFVPPKRAELGDTDQSLWGSFEDGSEKDPWQFTNSVVMTSVDGQTVYTFTTSSKTGVNSFGALMREYGDHLRQCPDEYPLISLQRSSYNDRRYGEIRFPVFQVVDWVEAAPYAAMFQSEQPPPPATRSISSKRK